MSTTVQLPRFDLDAVTQGRRTYVAVDDLQAYLEAVAQAAPEDMARMLRTIRAELEIGVRGGPLS